MCVCVGRGIWGLAFGFGGGGRGAGGLVMGLRYLLLLASADSLMTGGQSGARLGGGSGDGGGVGSLLNPT